MSETWSIIPKAPKAHTWSRQERDDLAAWYGALRRLPPDAMSDDDAYDTLWLYGWRLDQIRNGRDDITFTHKQYEIVLRLALDDTGTPEATRLQQDFADLIRKARTRRLARFSA